MKFQYRDCVLETIDKAIEDAEAQKAKSFADQGTYSCYGYVFVLIFSCSSNW